MQTAEIRRRFLEHFAERGHTVVPSASLVSPDPSLLFTVAGMVPFIPYLTGREPAPFPRATSVQKCVRTLDIDEVGKTTRHGTFFQMNGNFSFGDYFKAGAIELAWELITRSGADGGYGLPEDKLWVTVYQDDDEAIGLWRRITGIPMDRIVRRGMKDNFWSMGIPGPAGPCSEIYLDRGPDYGPEGGPEVDEDRYLEFWNLVFMQYERGPGGEKEGYELLRELPAKNIDTGMGLERMALLLQGVDNLYEIDEVFSVIRRVQELSGRKYGADHESDVRMRVVADHVRSGLMLITDGVTPSNETRGYVLRRLLRRGGRARRPGRGAGGGGRGAAAAGGGGAGAARPGARQRRPDGAELPRGAVRVRPDVAGRRAGGGGVPAHARVRDDDPRHRGPQGEAGGGRGGAGAGAR